MKDIDAIRRENLRLIEKEAKGPAEAAKLLGMSHAQFTNLRDGAKDSKTGKPRGMRKETARRIELAASKTAGWLDLDHSTNIGNVSHTNGSSGDVPLISWVQAGSWNEAIDNFQPGDAEDWLPCVRKHSKSSYALRVDGDSMTAPHGNTRTYPEGCIIFVDPERRSPVNGDRIIARRLSDGKVTFKVFKQEDGRTWLQPLNPSHEPIRDPFKVLGTVIGKWEDE